MAEYIERAVAVKAVLRERKPTNSVAQNRMLSIIQRDLLTMPAADVAPVVHGHWICEWDQESGTTTITCSQCKCNRVMKGCYVSTDGTALWDEENYCPDCGAKMDGGADHDTN